MKSKVPSSNTDNIRQKLKKMIHQREKIELKEKELCCDMETGAVNLQKINKILRTSEVVDEFVLQLDDDAKYSYAQSKKNTLNGGAKKVVKPQAKDTQSLNGLKIIETFIMPSGLRISDWCFNSPLDSTPPGNNYHIVFVS